MTRTTDDSLEKGPDCDCKVGTVAARYDLESFVQELAREWRTESIGVRPLTSRFNRQVIDHVIGQTELDVYDTESIHDILRGEVGSAGQRTELKGSLEREGVDVAELTDSTISHQTLYRHLTECLEVSPDDEHLSSEIQLDRAIETTRRLEGRTTNVVADRIDQLEAAGELSIGEYEVFTDVEVLCTDCSQVLPFEDLVKQGGCDCE